MNKLIYADKIATRTDKQVIFVCLICSAVSVILLTAMLIIKITLPVENVETLLLPLLIGIMASMSLVTSLIFTVSIFIRKKSLKVYLSLFLVIISIALLITALII